MNHNTTTRTATQSPLTVVRAAHAGLALLAVTVAGAGCAPVTDDEARTANPVSSSTPQPSAEAPSANPQGEESTSSEADAEIEQMLADIDSATEVTDDYWRTHWSEFFNGEYTAPEVVGMYDGDSARPPLCGGEPLVDDNAVYCHEGHYVAWDDDFMLRSLDLGNSWLYFVIAHEWGHAVQAHLDPSLHWNAKELQADCLAGAALYGAAEDGTITLPDDFTSQMVDNLDELADKTPWTDSGDHGDAFDRIDAFNDGRNGGVQACLPQR